MSDFVDFSIRKREEEVLRILQKASPVIVWPCNESLLVVAANKDKHENRIHVIFDRIICVTLGGFSAGTILWHDAVLRASAEGYGLSKGDVSCRILVKGTSAILSDSFQNLRRGPVFGAEAVFVEVASDRKDDYLAHAIFDGFIETFDSARLFGKIPGSGRDVRDESNQATELARERLERLWNPELSTQDSLSVLRDDQIFLPVFNSARVEVVVLDRQAVRNEEFRKVLKRLS